MRVLGFGKMWDKLEEPKFTTFRFARKDKDWHEGEVVQVVFKPRGKERNVLGIATIIEKHAVRIFPDLIPDPIYPIAAVTEAEAMADGFPNLHWMQLWFFNTYKRRAVNEPINKLTLEWSDRHSSENV